MGNKKKKKRRIVVLTQDLLGTAKASVPFSFSKRVFDSTAAAELRLFVWVTLAQYRTLHLRLYEVPEI